MKFASTVRVFVLMYFYFYSCFGESLREVLDDEANINHRRAAAKQVEKTKKSQTMKASCVGYCGSTPSTPGECSCHELCAIYGNCCSNACSQCGYGCTVKAPCKKNELLLIMEDSAGDGWNLGAMALYDDTSGNLIQKYTFNDGYYSAACVKVEKNTCYTFKKSSDGFWTSEERSYNLCGKTNLALETTSLSFCIGDTASSCTPGIVVYIVTIGSSTSNSKAVTVEADDVLTCPETVHMNNWLTEATYDDTFSISVDESTNTVTATRTDSDGGWGMDLSFNCHTSPSGS